MTNKNIHYYKELFLLTDADLELIRQAGQQLDSSVVDFVTNKFKAFLKTTPEHYNMGTEEVLNTVEAIKLALWTDIVTDPLNANYVEQQRQFGMGFNNLGIPYEGYVIAIVNYYALVIEQWKAENLLSEGLLYAFKKAEGLQTFVIQEIYKEESERVLMEQNKALSEMSTPITQLWDGILLLPLVGFIDSKRAQDVMTAMLDMISSTQAKVFILDIGGVAVVDTAVANYLIKMTKASRLMGCTCLISGISGSVAQTIVELGIQIEEVSTTGTMKEALNQALGVTGAQVVYLQN